MPLDGAWNAYIFREGKTRLRGPELLNELIRRLTVLSDLGPQGRRNSLLDLTIRCGELECAFADVGSPQSATLASFTDALAAALVSRHALDPTGLALKARMLQVPEAVVLTPPEGFAYYSLHPLDFADLIPGLETTSQIAAVVGIRSIGTTLSAVVQAALRAAGIQAERTTVRPTGHPYDRRCEFTGDQLRWIAAMLSHRADFLVVDEGPGMSGSSFLSVGDALISAGVPRANIAFLGSREPDPASLTARNAAERWVAFRSYCTSPTRHLPRGATRFVAGGIWRADFYPAQDQWPASWLQMERLKFTSETNDLFYKFEGYGRFGEAVHQRTIAVAEAGYGPMPLRFEEGFGVFPMLRGRICNKTDASTTMLQRIAEYCAFRAKAFATDLPANAKLEEMLRFNVKNECGAELLPQHYELSVVKPVIADGRMLPHKWIDSDGALLKFDSAIHGDDHFFPGPTDIAWDLAGAIVEWELDRDTTRSLLDYYIRSSGDDVQSRLPNYLLAYSIFRTAFCKMAAASMQGSEEEARLVRDYHHYRSRAEALLQTAFKPATAKAAAGPDARELRIA
jgi:hypothetical protein